MFVSRLLVLLSPPFSVFATRKEMGKNNAIPRRKGESPKEEERGQSKVGGPSSHFCVVLLFSPLSFRVVLLRVVMLSHRSLVWRFFPFLGGAVFFFGVALLFLLGWCCFRSPSLLSGVLLSFFLLELLPPSTRAGVLLSPPPPLIWCCFPLLGGAAFSSPFFWVVLPSPFLLLRLVVLCRLPLFLGPLGCTAWSAPSSGGAAFLSPIRVVLISPSPPATIKLASRDQSTQVTTDRQHAFVLHLRERELLTSIGRYLHEFPLCVSPETFFWTANLERVEATSSSERSEGGRLGEAETLAQFQAFLDKKNLFAEERVRCVRLVEVWNIVKSPRHPSLVLACPHEQIQDEDGIGEEAVKNHDKRKSGSNQRTERFFGDDPKARSDERGESPEDGLCMSWPRRRKVRTLFAPALFLM